MSALCVFHVPQTLACAERTYFCERAFTSNVAQASESQPGTYSSLAGFRMLSEVPNVPPRFSLPLPLT